MIRNIEYFRELLERSRKGRDGAFENINLWRKQYEGDMRDGTYSTRNVTYELIESQVSTNVPAPRCDPEVWSEQNGRNAKSIELLCQMLRNKLNAERINDEDERTTYIEGADIFFVEWDNTIQTHGECGGIRLSCISPNDFFPQPDVYRVEDMDWMIVRFNSTRQEIREKYDVGEAKSLLASKDNQGTGGDVQTDEDSVTVFMAMYKGENGNIGQFIWSGDAVLLDIPDYYCRKRWVCNKCGKRRLDNDEKKCECGGKFVLDNDEYEELTHDIHRGSDGLERPLLATTPLYKDGKPVLEDVPMPMMNPDGTPMMNVINGVNVQKTQMIQQPKMVRTRIPWYIPKTFPVVIRKNTSKANSVLGQSDCEFIRPHQIAINDISTKMHEKILASGCYPTKPEGVEFEYDDTINAKVLNIPEGKSANQFGCIDLTPDISKEMVYSENLYAQLKRVMGISDSYQGQADNTAKSGVAKQAQIQQSAGRLDSKRVMKNAAWSDLDRIFFEFYLAYADEPRKLVYTDENGIRHNAEFNRYDFVEYDEIEHEYFYNDRYLFSVDLNGGAEQQRETMWQLNQNNFAGGTFGNPQEPQTLLRYWQMQEMSHYPHARENVEYFKNIVEQMNAQAQMNAQMQGGMKNGIVQ